MPEAASDRQGGRVQDAKTFEFDRVFGPESTQAAVFDEVQVRLLLRLAPFYSGDLGASQHAFCTSTRTVPCSFAPDSLW